MEITNQPDSDLSPTQDSVVEETPVEDTPTEETPTEETPKEETPAAPAAAVETPSASEEKKWYVLRVASNREDTVCDNLIRKVKVEGLEGTIGRIMVPTERRPAPQGRGAPKKKKFVERKMYPGYVFVEMALEDDGMMGEDAWFLIKETNGVGDFIGSEGKPSPMDKAEVDRVLMQVEMAEEGTPVSLEFEPGDLVKIKEGPFENFEGTVDSVLPEKGTVRVVATIFGRSTPVELKYWQIEKS